MLEQNRGLTARWEARSGDEGTSKQENNVYTE